MKNSLPLMFALVVLLAAGTAAQNLQKLKLEHTDELEVVFEGGRYVTYVNGNVEFTTETGKIFSDSAVFVRGEYAILRGNVLIDDEEYMLRGDSVHYNLTNETAVARGKNVQLWSYADSLYAVGTHAFFDRQVERFFMEERPTVYMGYPDSSRMIEVIGDLVDYQASAERAEAIGNVTITSEEFSATSDCAVLLLEERVLDLYDSPVAKRGQSTISGGFMSLVFDAEQLSRIDVIDSAHAEFIEPVDTTETEFDRSILSGSRIKLFFANGELDQVLSYGQAFSWYYPSQRGSREYHENTVSGDTIRFFVEDESLQRVTIIGGAEGTYVTGKLTDEVVVQPDSLELPDTTLVVDEAGVEASGEQPRAVTLDTIDYRAHYIEYSLADSIISLRSRSEVQSGNMMLRAHDVEFDTRRRTVEAYSAEINPDEKDVDFYNLAARLQPATIPVILKDGDAELLGDYLEYSIDTEKGRIVQTKSAFEQGFYYGGKLFREKRDVYYIDDGYYTTCDADEPHFHFNSSRMKLMENNKLIAKPVVFYLGRIPLLAIPYYVFPLEKGRHSGFLPFTFGRFEQGERYINNLGYYWAASEYWDVQGAIDYYEQRRTLTFKSGVQFRQRYVLDGYVKGEYRQVTNYSEVLAQESSPTSYQLEGAYSHEISPSFNIRASGSYISTASYYTDYSNSLEERLRRDLVSQVNFSKRFANQVSITGSVQHRENLDLETRTDQLPSLSVSLPPIYPFGSSSTNADGDRVTRWYQGFILRYSPSLLNYSSRNTIVTDVDTLFDTTVVVDTLGNPIDTTFNPILVDTTSARSRRHYARIQHNPGIALPALRLAPYVTIVPSVAYSETWFKIFETDQSRAAGIDASRFYRTYSYSAAVSASTKLYGTVYPNLFGLLGLRHVFEPSVGYSWSPEIQQHTAVRQFAGGGAASSRSQRINLTFSQLFQAKFRRGTAEQNLDLLSVSSSLSYDFEREFRPWSQVNTSFHTSTIPRVNVSGSMVHSLYNPNDPLTETPEFLSPWLLSFDLNLSFQLSGRVFFFSDPQVGIPMGADSAVDLAAEQINPVASSEGWNLAVTYSYAESGRHSNFSQKRNFVNFTLGFGLTPSTSVNYMQRYDIVDGRTISSQVNIVRNLHCWTGSLFWVPVGSNRGFGFKLWVTQLPDIKLDSNHDTFVSSDVLRRP